MDKILSADLKTFKNKNCVQYTLSRLRNTFVSLIKLCKLFTTIYQIKKSIAKYNIRN